MNKYRVLKTNPKVISNSGRLVTLRKGSHVYLKPEPKVIRLVLLGYLQPIIEFNKRPKKRSKANQSENKYKKKNKGKQNKAE